jgi:hypothetical protein
LPGIREQVLHDGSAPGRLFRRKERLAGNEPVVHRVLPGLAARALPHDDPDAVVAHVERLARPLDAIADHRHHLVLQDFPGALQGEFVVLHHLFHHSAEIECCHLVCSFVWLVETTQGSRFRVQGPRFNSDKTALCLNP